MSANSPRVRLVLDRHTYDAIARLARRDQVSVHSKIRELVKEGLELEEDEALGVLAARREKTFKGKGR